MGTGSGSGLNFGGTSGSAPETIKEEDWFIGKSLSAAAKNYSVKDPSTGRAYKFLEGTAITNVETFAGKGVRKKLSSKVTKGLCEQIGGRPRDWKHVKGVGTLDVDGKATKAEVHWFEAKGYDKVKFKVKEWLQ